MFLQLRRFHVQSDDAGQGDLRQALKDAPSNLQTRGGERGSRRDQPVLGKTHGDLGNALHHRIALQLHAEHASLFLFHAEQRVGLLDVPVGGILEERA